jgi:hypothetical protein
MSLSCGAHAQTVRVAGCWSAAAIAAALPAPELLAAPAADAEAAGLEAELEQAARTAARARPAVAPAAVLAIRERGKTGIVAPLSVTEEEFND